MGVVRHGRTLGMALALAGAVAAQTTGKTLEVKLGATVARSWDDVKRADYAYGPKQEYLPASRETHVWLAYGKDGEYYDATGLNFTAPGKQGTGAPLAVTRDGNTSGRLVYKLRFDQPVGALRCSVGWSEWGVGGDSVGGVEFSHDGLTWTTIRELSQGGIVEPLADGKRTFTFPGSRDLYLRLYSRDKLKPDAAFGPGRWMKIRMAGDPGWGDAATTFFRSQVQLWVQAAADAPAPQPPPPPPAKPRDTKADGNPWAIASGAEWSGEYPKFNPLLRDAGVKWLRLFPEWHGIQPRQGEWRWDRADAMVADARANGMQIAGLWCYFASWASADGGTRRGPVKDMRFWRDYVAATASRYRADIGYWEVWNEFNGSFYQGVDKPKEYADLVVAAYDTLKQVAPEVKLGLSVANFDVAFLDATIKAGAADHFDYVCVHPYENLGAVAEGGEVGFLSLAGNVRQMLAANRQRADLPLWITEIGHQAPIKPEAKGDAAQADQLVKAYLLSLVQGFARVFWFEARGPAYGKGTDHGIIRPDWTRRPAYDALRTLTGLLGGEPRYLGWLDLGPGGYGFLFAAAQGAVLAAWAPPGKQPKATFAVEVKLTDLAGTPTALRAGRELALTGTPRFVTGLPADLVATAQANRARPYPWGGNWARVKTVKCRLGAVNQESGLQHVRTQTTLVENDLTETCRRTNFADPALKGEGHYLYFRVDPLFVPYGTKDLAITIVAKRVAPDKQAGMNLMYEATKGYRGAGTWWTIPEGDGWHESTWKVSDANFVGQWGFNFRFDAVSSPNEFLVKEVRVSKAGAD